MCIRDRDNSRGTYQYHFVNVLSEEAPFVKPANELPLVKVEIDNPQEAKKRWWSFAKRKKRKRKKEKASKESLTYISIELTGGGFYGGINPVTKDFVHIKNDGRLIRELQNEQDGLLVTKKTISRAELEKFAEAIIDKGFFEMERVYNCESPICFKRLQKKPKPIPLRIAVAYGDRRKVITINIFGQDNRKIRYLDYPKELDQIIAGIQNMVHRIDPS